MLQGISVLMSAIWVHLLGGASKDRPMRLWNLKVGDRGILLVAVPLVFLIALVAQLIFQQHKNELTQEASIHSQEIIGQTEALLTAVSDAESSVVNYAVTQNANSLKSFQQAKNNSFEVLRQ